MTSKPTLIMIHGFRGTREGLDLIAHELRDDVDLVVPDLPGFGHGKTLPSYRLDDYITFLHEIVGRYTAPILLGHSFGSIISAAYAATYPDTISKLILVNPIGAPALEGPRGFLSNLAVAYYWVGKKLPAKLGKSWLSSKPSVLVMSKVMTKTKDKKTRAFIHQQHLQHFSRFHSADSVYQGFLTSVSNSVRDVAAQIITPTLLIAGEKDDITPLNKQKELANLFPHARLTVIKNVGHLTHYETPDQVAHAVQSFIKEE